MPRFNSVRTRIVVLTTIPLSVLLVLFLLLTLKSTSNTVRNSIRNSLSDAGSVFVKLLESKSNELQSMASVTARDPRFFATFAIPTEERGEEFGPTVDGVAVDFLLITGADFIEILDRNGHLVSYVSRDGSERAAGQLLGAGSVREALRGMPSTDCYGSGTHLVVAGVAPVFVGQRIEAVVRIGSFFDHDLVEEVKRLTGAEVRMTENGKTVASTYDISDTDEADVQSSDATAATAAWDLPSLSAMMRRATLVSNAYTVPVGETEYLAVRVRVRGVDAHDGFDAELGRELSTELAPIVRFSQQMLVAGVVAILVTFMAAYLLARQITRPLSEIVVAASELEKGNYEQPLRLVGADEIATLGRSFDEMRQSLQAHVSHLQNVDQMKSDFIALAAHELKTPLTVITAFNEMIVSGETGDLPEEFRETTQLIQVRLQDLNRLVENILDMSRFEQGLVEFQLERADLCEITLDAIRKRQEQIARRHVKLTTEIPNEPIHGRCESRRIEQAILHLLDNAVRFTPDGGSIRVRLEKNDGEVLISILDSGIGIPSKDLSRLFDKSREVHDVMHHTSGWHEFGSRGLGLGLALCKAIVTGHGGDVRVKSRVGQGSEFTLVLPLAVEAATPELALSSA